MPLLAMAMKALLLRTQSVWLLLLRSVTITVVPLLLHKAVFLHLICQKPVRDMINHLKNPQEGKQTSGVV